MEPVGATFQLGATFGTGRLGGIAKRQARFSSVPQQTFAETLPNGWIEAVTGVLHGVNLLQPERCARLAAEFWRTLG